MRLLCAKINVLVLALWLGSLANSLRAEDAPAVPKDREAALKTLLAHLNVGEGSTMADIGAGKGRDTWVFAEIVGKSGKVYAEEIAESLVKELKKKAEKDGVSQVRAVLGKTDDPSLPQNSVDLAFMHLVYHHFTKPREMLRAIWRTLKPGGYLVIVDRNRGVLRDWVEREERGPKHHWIGETTVVREAREEGFTFAECPDNLWYQKEPFVLVFQRPVGVDAPGTDPDRFESLALEGAVSSFMPPKTTFRRPVFIALGEARQLIAPILEKSSGQGLEIVLEEWATSKDEKPTSLSVAPLPSTLTDKGDPQLGSEPIDAVFFLDSYHLLFQGKTLLAKFHEALAPGGQIYVLDRKADRPVTRREASHRKMISPETVKQEMTEAGFVFQSTGPELAKDRFLLMFQKVPSLTP